MGFTKLLRKIATGSPESSCSFDENNNRPVGITTKLANITVKHKGEDYIIQRDQNSNARTRDLFTKTSRPCPPFCIQPMTISSGVETIGELEILSYLQQSTLDHSILVIDTRIKEWVDKGTIPSSTHIPWTSLTSNNSASLNTTITLLCERFNVKIVKEVHKDEISNALTNGKIAEFLDFSNAKTLVMFCNGSWCGQTSEAIKALLALSYPKEKLKYYRDGMQGWVSLGLTTISQDETCKIKKPFCENESYRVIS